MAKTQQSNELLRLEGEEKRATIPAASNRSRRPLLLVGGGVVFVVFALALGLGLGLGLKHHNHGNSAATHSSTPAASRTPTNVPSTASEVLQPWRRDTAEYNLDMGWDINAAPTTRVFNLTVSEIEAAPDGEIKYPL
jgi:hypothetical protein